MARTPPPPPPPYEEAYIVEEEYIDMDVSSATLVCYCSVPSPPPHSRDFEFQMSAKSTPLPEMDGIVSPADELFYKGKLLPLHLPPRLQLVQKLLHDSKAPPATQYFAHSTTVTTTSAATTPYESCNVSPGTSCYVSGELNPEDYCLDNDEYECRRKERTSRSKSSWTKKLRHNSSSSRSLKLLKASGAYLKSLFTKSPGCSDQESCAPVPKAKGCPTAHAKVDTKKIKSMTSGDVRRANSSALLSRRVDAEKMVVEEGHGHRRSFSGAMIKRRVALPNKSSSSSSSSSSASCSSSSNSSSFSSVNGLAALKRSSSVNSEVECSIQGAIAYCKKSSQQDQLCSISRKSTVSDVDFYVLSASRIAADCEKLQERPEICRG